MVLPFFFFLFLKNFFRVFLDFFLFLIIPVDGRTSKSPPQQMLFTAILSTNKNVEMKQYQIEFPQKCTSFPYSLHASCFIFCFIFRIPGKVFFQKKSEIDFFQAKLHCSLFNFLQLCKRNPQRNIPAFFPLPNSLLGLQCEHLIGFSPAFPTYQ